MERNLENVHVVIYSKKMLKQAIKRLNKLGQNVEIDIISEYEFHGNDLLTCEKGLFQVVNSLMYHPNHEVTLNQLCEMVIDKEDSKLKVGDWIYSELKSDPQFGFTVCQIQHLHTADHHNDESIKSLYNIKKIDQETAERLRKELLCGKQ